MGLFGKKKSSADAGSVSATKKVSMLAAHFAPSATDFAPGTEIAYHADLIGRFKMTHNALRKLFDAVKTQAADGQFADAQKSLEAFRKTLTGHLLEENIKLYTYLTMCLVSDADSKDLMASMKTEMGRIGGTVMAFVRDYSHSGISPANQQAFLEGWSEIGATLADRLEREETSLYSMYMPPQSFG